ncbi:hypothetical protein ACU4GD_41690 [Cupriavidus basilensis]
MPPRICAAQINLLLRGKTPPAFERVAEATTLLGDGLRVLLRARFNLRGAEIGDDESLVVPSRAI